MNLEIKISPENLLQWGDFEDWAENGASGAPTPWTLSGSSAAAAREATTVKKGTYSAKLTRSGADCMIYYDLPTYINYQGRKLTLGFWVYATVASRARITINDGVGSSSSSYHTGDSTWQRLTITRDIDPAATKIEIRCEVNTGNTSAFFDGGLLCEGDSDIIIFSNYADIVSFTPSPVFRGQEYPMARRVGEKLPRYVLSSQSFELIGRCVGTSIQTQRDNTDVINRMINSFRDKSSGDQEMRDFYVYDDRFLRGLLSQNNPSYEAVMKVGNFDLMFIVPDIFYYSLQMYRTKQSLSSSPITFTVTTNGTAITRPVITITAGGSNITSVTIENLTTGQLMSYSGTILAGNSLVIDCTALTVLNNNVDDFAHISNDTEVDLLPGANQFRITSAATGGTARIDAYDRFI